MSSTSTIEWTDATWNPVTGCTKVSPGCDHCYAETFAERWRGTPGHHFEHGFDVQLRPEKLDLPLRWKKPRKVFVNSMADLFHDDVPDEYIARIFAVMAATPEHTYQILTKRHARMRSMLNRGEPGTAGFFDDVETAMADYTHADPVSWPLPNVWLGVSVEDQQWANIRIPALLDTPAAVRWISAEPLLGPIDLNQWIPPLSPMDPASAPKTWAEWTWPAWVPTGIREPVEKFWMERWGRGPHAWMRNMHEQGAPAFGATVTLDDGFGPNASKITGRYVHAWNNIGRIVHDDGTFSYTSFGPRSVRENQSLNWVVVGGESGPGARPMHPAWARSIRDQCLAASVPFLFKQRGQWTWSDPGPGCSEPTTYVSRESGEVTDEERALADGGDWQGVWKVGKGRAGRTLDGELWDQYPAGAR